MRTTIPNPVVRHTQLVVRFMLEHPWLSAGVAAVVILAVTILLTRWTLRVTRGGDRSDDNVSTAGLRLVGAAFALLGSFLVVTLWAAQGNANDRLTNEMAELSNMVRAIEFFDPAQAQQAVQFQRSYVEAVRDEELGAGALSPNAGRGYNASPRAQQAFEGLAGIAATDPANLAQPFASLVAARDLRLGWRPPASLLTLAPALVITGVVVVMVGMYPAGGSHRQKWLQSMGSALAICALVAMILLLLSPSAGDGARREALNDYLSSIG